MKVCTKFYIKHNMLPSVSRQSFKPITNDNFLLQNKLSSAYHPPTCEFPSPISILSPFNSYLRMKNRRNARQAQKGNRDELGTRLRVSGCLPRAILGFVSEQKYISLTLSSRLHLSFHSRSPQSLRHRNESQCHGRFYNSMTVLQIKGCMSNIMRYILFTFLNAMKVYGQSI